jgi:hypothetical protein
VAKANTKEWGKGERGEKKKGRGCCMMTKQKAESDFLSAAAAHSVPSAVAAGGEMILDRPKV